jgi:hypothetical protein
LDSVIAKELNGKFPPIALLLSNEKPADAIGPKPGQHGCTIVYIAKAITEGKTVVFDRETCCCNGAVVGLGLGTSYYDSLPGGIESYAAFFSHGMETAREPEQYRKACDGVPPHERRKFEIGERYFDTPERAYNFVTKDLPVYNFPERYRIFKPLSEVSGKEKPQTVTFTVNGLGLTVLVTLDGALRDGVNCTLTPQCSACQMLGAQVFRQAESENPRAVLGLLDLASRIYTRKLIPEEYLTYSVPWKLFLALEEEAKTGVFQSPIWLDLKKVNSEVK